MWAVRHCITRFAGILLRNKLDFVFRTEYTVLIPAACAEAKKICLHDQRNTRETVKKIESSVPIFF